MLVWGISCNFASVKIRLFILSLIAASMTTMLAADEVPLDTLTLEEVSVTAIKQGADVDLTTSSTVLGQHQVEHGGIVTVRNVSDLVPNFFLPDYGSRMHRPAVDGPKH